MKGKGIFLLDFMDNSKLLLTFVTRKNKGATINIGKQCGI